jgi:exopolysaccharide biosynthesis protein
MFKRILLIVVVLNTSLHALAQNSDSLTIVKAKWTSQRIMPKVRLKTHHFNTGNLFGSNENISYLEVKNKRSTRVFKLAAERSVLKTTSAFAVEHQAEAAINGTFFDVKNGGSVDYVKVDGTVLGTTRLEANQQRARHQKSAIVISEGKLSIVKWDGTADWENQLAAENVMISGPLLTYNGQNEELDSASFTTARHPRTAIGIKPDGKIILVTVDGRNAQSAGMSLIELRETMRWLGCSTSINLDGGGSTALWIKKAGIVNYPTDNKKWDHEGERKVANVVLISRQP